MMEPTLRGFKMQIEEINLKDSALQFNRPDNKTDHREWNLERLEQAKVGPDPEKALRLVKMFSRDKLLVQSAQQSADVVDETLKGAVSNQGTTCCSRFSYGIMNYWDRFSEAIPRRYIMAMTGNCGFFMVYAMRVVLSVTIVSMAGGPKVSTNSDNIACPELVSTTSSSFSNGTTAAQDGDEVRWSLSTQSLLHGAFFYGYVTTQIPGGILAEKYGAKKPMGIGVLITAIGTLLTPFAANHSFGALMAVRIIEGLGEGVTYPAMNALIGRWVPKMERSRISTFIFMGSPIGTVVTLSISGFISDSDALGGWPTVYYLLGGLGCIWCVFWFLLIHESPEVHPSISKEELQFIRDGQELHQSSGPIPWRSILTSCPVWTLAIAHFGFNWGFYTLLTELPTYLANMLHFNLKHNGLLSAAPYVCQSVAAVTASAVADSMRSKGRYRITTIRKIMNTVAFFLPGIFVGAVAFTGCHSHLIVVLIVVSVGFSGFMYSGFNVTHVDMSPEFAGTLMGITNCIANTAGFLAPAYVGWAVKDGQTIGNWGLVFLTTAAVYFVTGTIYNIFASAELQPWGTTAPQLPSNEKPEDRRSSVNEAPS